MEQRFVFGLSFFFLMSTQLAYALPQLVLYPNQHLQSVGSEQARRDINECAVNANDYLSSHGNPHQGRQQVGRNAARGAALGALAATITKGNAGRGAGAGAAVGGLQGLGQARQQKKEGSPEYRKYIEACLEDRGYRVIGWKG